MDSVIEQTFYDWELIIVDDGSTDNTSELIENYSVRDNRIRYIYQENAERSAARNNGIDHAQGEFICFLDSDDYYLPNRLRNLSEYLKKETILNSFYYTAITYDFGEKLEERTERKRFPNENVFEFIVQAIIGTPQVIISRDLLLNQRFDPRWRIGEDMELWLRLAKLVEPTFISNEATVIASEHEDRSVNLKKYNSGKEQLALFKKIFTNEHSGKLINSGLTRNLYSNCYFSIFRFWFYKKKRIYCLIFIAKCVMVNLKSEQLKFRMNIFIRLLFFQSFEKINKLLI